MRIRGGAILNKRRLALNCGRKHISAQASVSLTFSFRWQAFAAPKTRPLPRTSLISIRFLFGASWPWSAKKEMTFFVWLSEWFGPFLHFRVHFSSKGIFFHQILRNFSGNLLSKPKSLYSALQYWQSQ